MTGVNARLSGSVGCWVYGWVGRGVCVFVGWCVGGLVGGLEGGWFGGWVGCWLE